MPTSPCCIDPFDRRSETLSTPFGTPSLPRPPPSYASALVDPAKLRKVRSARAHGRASRTLAERVAGVLRPHLHRFLLWPKVIPDPRYCGDQRGWGPTWISRHFLLNRQVSLGRLSPYDCGARLSGADFSRAIERSKQIRAVRRQGRSLSLLLVR